MRYKVVYVPEWDVPEERVFAFLIGERVRYSDEDDPIVQEAFDKFLSETYKRRGYPDSFEVEVVA